MADSWRHRSKGMTCATCMWSVIKEPEIKPNPPGPLGENAEMAETPTPKPKLGRCRRRAPTMNGYPAIFENDWCGDHKLDENKILIRSH